MKDIEKIDAALDIIKKSEASHNIKRTAEVLRNGLFERLEMCRLDSYRLKFAVNGYCAGWNQFIIMLFGEGVDGLLDLTIEDSFKMVEDYLREVKNNECTDSL